MAKKKRTYNSEVLTPAALHLQKTGSALQKRQDQTDQRVAPKQFFAPELINRLAEKIKKL